MLAIFDKCFLVRFLLKVWDTDMQKSDINL